MRFAMLSSLQLKNVEHRLSPGFSREGLVQRISFITRVVGGCHYFSETKHLKSSCHVVSKIVKGDQES